MPGVVLCLSGGIDSTVLAAQLAKDDKLNSCIFFDYDQPSARQELAAARACGKRHRVHVEPVKVTMYALDAMKAKPGIGPRVVPYRNLVMASIAMNFASSMGGVDVVAMGPTSDDRADYKDCSVDFAFNLSTATWRIGGISLRFPFATYSRKEVLKMARDLGVDLSETWSCYSPVGEKRCGVCSGCASSLCVDTPTPEE